MSYDSRKEDVREVIGGSNSLIESQVQGLG